MARSRSSLDIFQSLGAADKEQRKEVESVKRNLAMPDWIFVGDSGAPAFQNSWGNLDTRGVGFWRDSSGIVHLTGFAANGVMGQIIFTLPAGFRPRFDRTGASTEYWFAVISAGALGAITINSIGQVFATLGTNGWISLNEIHFRADN